ncbi:MAG: Spy/CpxP family protein refolding chaperone [Betaproteobacteria bacterium]|nr:Spy/CpxP family protein refolding chaperone [Betaproteobacteria bacterium]
MKHMNLRKSLIAAALIGVTTLGTTALVGAQQEGYGPGYGRGPGMMGGYGPGMMGGYGPGPGGGYGPGAGGGYGPGYGMGPGMMGGYGSGPGGGYGPGYGMGPGMMGGMMGPGMMGGYGSGFGMGPGMMGGGMGYGMLYQLNLSPDQWSKVNTIHEDLAKKQWDLAGKTREEAYKLRNLMAAEKRDRSAITNQYKKLQELRLQSFQARLETQEKIDGVLTKEQKGQIRRFAPWWGRDVE